MGAVDAINGRQNGRAAANSANFFSIPPWRFSTSCERQMDCIALPRLPELVHEYAVMVGHERRGYTAVRQIP